MNRNNKNNADHEFDEPAFSEVFARESSSNPTARDIFAGDSRTYRGLGRSSLLAQGRSRGAIPFTHIFLAINLVIITALLCYIIFRPPIVPVAAYHPAPAPAPTPRPDVDTRPTTVPSTAAPVPQPQPVNDTSASQPVSWKTAETLYYAGEYEKALYVFTRLADHLPPGDNNESFKDYLHLMMALAIENAANGRNPAPYFTAALQSRSPVVRALANYRLALIENRNRQFLDVRKRAYRTIALIRAFENHLPQTLEADSYFLAAEALTRHVLTLNNAPDRLPGQLWSDSLRAETIPPMDQADLRRLLRTGAAELAVGAAGPQVQKQQHLTVGVRWSAVSLEAPLEELAARIASTADMNLVWAAADNLRTAPVTMCLSNASEQFVAETAAAAAGAVARFDDQTITIHDPQAFADLEQYKSLLTSEAIAVWRRFTLRYRGDHRMPNAHYALGLLLDYAGQTPAALGEYKLVSSRYPSNPLAPFALLNASIIKTNLQDYTAARQDLTELLIQYPDCKVIDVASLHLAEATMRTGLYDEAAKMYKRVYNLELNNRSRREAAHGLGRCCFDTKQYDQAAQWFAAVVDLTDGAADQLFRNASFMLGQCYIKLNRFAEASQALLSSVDDNASQDEFVRVILQLVKAETGRANYVDALNILENVPTERLSQEDSVAVLRATAEILLELDLVETATTLLRRKIEFIADSTLRAQLAFDLAQCYAAAGDLQLARREVSHALADLPTGDERRQAFLLLAELSLQLESFEQAADACLALLAEPIDDKNLSDKAHRLLGACYTRMKQYDKAALAYAGIHNFSAGGIDRP